MKRTAKVRYCQLINVGTGKYGVDLKMAVFETSDNKYLYWPTTSKSAVLKNHEVGDICNIVFETDSENDNVIKYVKDQPMEEIETAYNDFEQSM